MHRHIPAAILALCLFAPQGGHCAQEGEVPQEKPSLLESLKGQMWDISDTARATFDDVSRVAKDKFSELSQATRDLLTKSQGQPQEDADATFFQKTWQQFSHLANEAMELATGKNPREKTAFEFVTLQEPKYVRLLKEAQDILANSQAREEFAAIEELRQKNRSLREEMTALRRERVGAPESSVNPLASTKSGIDKKLAQLPVEIAANDQKIAQLKNSILLQLQKHGVALSPQALDYFTISAEGDDLMKLMAMAENMKRIQQAMEEDLKKGKNDVDLARIYTGMYLISLEAYAQAHDAAIKKIPAYRSKLAAIGQEAAANKADAEQLLPQATAEDKAHVEGNIRLNDHVIEVARMYDGLLNRREQNLAASRNKVEQKVQVARNTYKTVANGASLIDLVHDGNNDYLLITNFQMPELQNLYEPVLRTAFTEISDRIKSEQ